MGEGGNALRHLRRRRTQLLDDRLHRLRHRTDRVVGPLRHGLFSRAVALEHLLL